MTNFWFGLPNKKEPNTEYHVCACSQASPEPEYERGEIIYPLRRRVSRKPGYLRNPRRHMTRLQWLSVKFRKEYKELQKYMPPLYQEVPKRNDWIIEEDNKTK